MTMSDAFAKKVGVDVRHEPLAARVAELEAENARLEAALESAEDGLATQEFRVLAGYIVTVWPVGDGTYVASCPTLHASVQEASKQRALQSLREAASVARAAYEDAGRPLPPRDVDAPWLDWAP